MSIVAPILEPAAYAHVFARWRGATIMEFWGPGNVGDLLIRRGAGQLYTAYDIKITDDAQHADAVFYGGGGNMGPLYPGTRLTRLEARAVATARCVPLIVLPQSWTGPEDFDADQFFARENRSLEYCPRAVLAPDLGLAYAPAIDLNEPQHDVGWFMRDDCERHQPAVATNCGDPAGGGRLGLKAEFLRAALAGLPAPEIHGELPGHRDDGFLSRRPGGAGAFGQHAEPLFDRGILRLEADQPPGQFDQRGS